MSTAAELEYFPLDNALITRLENRQVALAFARYLHVSYLMVVSAPLAQEILASAPKNPTEVIVC
jgi:hypothetical protein